MAQAQTERIPYKVKDISLAEFGRKEIAIAEKDFRSAMLWMFVSLVIDGVDGTFARFFQVSRVLPQMSGKTMDYVIDFTTYGVIPAYFFFSSAVTSLGK